MLSIVLKQRKQETLQSKPATFKENRIASLRAFTPNSCYRQMGDKGMSISKFAIKLSFVGDGN